MITGSASADIFYGGDGADTIYGITGADTLYGDAGADVIYASDTGVLVYGGEGNDTIHAALSNMETGVTTLYGGDGADEFTFGSADVLTSGANLASVTITVIADFERGTDKISLFSIFASTVSPAFRNAAQSAVLANTDEIQWSSDGTDTRVSIVGNADEYLQLTISGVTTLALTDFEIL